MTFVRSNKSLNCLQWSLLMLFVCYWLIFFPIIWFVIAPVEAKRSISNMAMHVVFFVAIYAVLHCLIYCCFKQYELNRADELEKRMAAVTRTLDAVTYVRNDIATKVPDGKRQEHLQLLRENMLSILCRRQNEGTV